MAADEPGMAPSGAARLFLALCPGASVRAAVAAHAAGWRWPDEARRYEPADWHVTLHFLGAVPRARLPELRAALALPVPPFILRFGQPALWPHGLAVLLPLALPEALQRLYAELGLCLRRLGLPAQDRPYRPHLTLARRASAAQPPAQWPAWDWPVRGYALMESTGEAGQRYRVLQQYGEGDDGAAQA